MVAGARSELLAGVLREALGPLDEHVDAGFEALEAESRDLVRAGREALRVAPSRHLIDLLA